VAPGSIQVDGSGQPTIMLADRQTTGGYAKIATVIGADLPLLGQMRPQEKLRFIAVDYDAALQALRCREETLGCIPCCSVARRVFQVTLQGNKVRVEASEI